MKFPLGLFLFFVFAAFGMHSWLSFDAPLAQTSKENFIKTMRETNSAKAKDFQTAITKITKQQTSRAETTVERAPSNVESVEPTKSDDSPIEELSRLWEQNPDSAENYLLEKLTDPEMPTDAQRILLLHFRKIAGESEQYLRTSQTLLTQSPKWELLEIAADAVMSKSSPEEAAATLINAHQTQNKKNQDFISKRVFLRSPNTVFPKFKELLGDAQP